MVNCAVRFNKNWILARAARGTVSLHEYLTGPGFKHLNTCKCRCKFSVTVNNEVHICGTITWIFCHRIVSRADLFYIFNHALNNRRFSFILCCIKCNEHLIFYGSEKLYHRLVGYETVQSVWYQAAFLRDPLPPFTCRWKQ